MATQSTPPAPTPPGAPSAQDIAFARAIVFLDRVAAGKGVPSWRRPIIHPKLRDALDVYDHEGTSKAYKKP